MNFLSFITAFCLISVIVAIPHPRLIETEDGDIFQLVPLERAKRQNEGGNGQGRGSLQFEAQRNEQLGTDLKATGRLNLHQDKYSSAHLDAFASRHYGGFRGTQPTNYGVMFNYRRRF